MDTYFLLNPLIYLCVLIEEECLSIINADRDLLFIYTINFHLLNHQTLLTVV